MAVKSLSAGQLPCSIPPPYYIMNPQKNMHTGLEIISGCEPDAREEHLAVMKHRREACWLNTGHARRKTLRQPWGNLLGAGISGLRVRIQLKMADTGSFTQRSVAPRPRRTRETFSAAGEWEPPRATLAPIHAHLFAVLELPPP